jgi:hypothetical protein
MKSLYILLLSCIIFIGSLAQAQEKESYLIVRMVAKHDRTNKADYFIIAADLYNDHAKDIYNLAPFHDEAYTNISDISFFFNRTKSSVFFYNYFRSQTEALEFLSQRHWQLVSVISEINSGYEREKSGDAYVPYTTVSSKPIYYFKKTLN